MIKSWMTLLVCMFLLAACQNSNSLAGTKWELAEIQGQPLLTGTRGTLEFTEDGTAGGFAGCNSFGTSAVEIKRESILFKDLAQTEMACLDASNNLNNGLMDQESRYMQALALVQRFEQEENSLVLLGEDGTRLLVFKPLAK